MRERQVLAVTRFVRDLAGEAPALPPIVVGDMNAEPDATEMRYLAGLTSLAGQSVYFQDAWRLGGDGGPGHTWDNRNTYAALSSEPTRRIDYVWVGHPREGRGVVEHAARRARRIGRRRVPERPLRCDRRRPHLRSEVDGDLEASVDHALAVEGHALRVHRAARRGSFMTFVFTWSRWRRDL